MYLSTPCVVGCVLVVCWLCGVLVVWCVGCVLLVVVCYWLRVVDGGFWWCVLVVCWWCVVGGLLVVCWWSDVGVLLSNTVTYHCHLPLLFTTVIYHCYLPLLFNTLMSKERRDEWKTFGYLQRMTFCCRYLDNNIISEGESSLLLWRLLTGGCNTWSVFYTWLRYWTAHFNTIKYIYIYIFIHMFIYIGISLTCLMRNFIMNLGMGTATNMFV